MGAKVLRKYATIAQFHQGTKSGIQDELYDRRIRERECEYETFAKQIIRSL